MTSADNSDTLGGPDRVASEDELAGPGTPGPDTLGGPDRVASEDELAEPGQPGPDTLGGPDPGDEDELHTGG
jgi:hypothetical protein